MELNNIDDVIRIILNCDYIEPDCGSGAGLSIPIYELTPEDFLEFAEAGITGKTKYDKVNTVSNLKRALDCQIDIFLGSLNLRKIFEKNNLKFEQKTSFLADIGVLSTNSINKLNSIRNKLEHDYKIPTIDDLEVYYELVWHVKEIIEAKLLLINCNGEICFSIFNEDHKYYLRIEYDIKHTGIKIEISNRTDDANTNTEDLGIFLEKKSDRDAFVKVFKVYLATIQFFSYEDLEQYKKNLNKLLE